MGRKVEDGRAREIGAITIKICGQINKELYPEL